MLKTYYRLTKPGIVYGNAVTAAAGFFLASRGHVNLWLLAAVLGGTSLVIACGCVINNYIDRDIDAKMKRTKRRALVIGAVTGRAAITYGITLGVLGFLILILYTNALVVAVGITGLFFYLLMYGVWKRRSPFGTIVGSVSGATPPVAGYVAVTNRVDTGAILLFLILVLWQMPHFYAIAMFRKDEYAAADIPVLSVKKGTSTVKRYIMAYIPVFTVAAVMLTVLGYTGVVYAVVVVLLGLTWLWKGISGPRDDKLWARNMFLFSLVVIVVLSVALSLNGLLP
jgi:heme o synthase